LESVDIKRKKSLIIDDFWFGRNIRGEGEYSIWNRMNCERQVGARLIRGALFLEVFRFFLTFFTLDPF